MKTSLDCIPCFIRQALEAARMVSDDPAVHESIVRDVLRWSGEMNLSESSPVMAQRIHRRLREMVPVEDPYRQAREAQNNMALRLIPRLRAEVERSDDPLMTAVRLAIAGNIIDMGVVGEVSEDRVLKSVEKALNCEFRGDDARFKKALDAAESILYLADNAGEIAFDLLLIERLVPERVILAVRGAPVINDATIDDARAVGLDRVVRVIENGSDAPGTLLGDCSDEFRTCFEQADLVISKGQGNFESLSSTDADIVFLFQAKCDVVADHVGVPLGTHLMIWSANGRGKC